MSDEERDIDMESCEDEIDVGTNENDSLLHFNAVVGINNDHHFGNFSMPHSISSGLNEQADRKRAHHNALERKRRDHIKDSFHTLRDAIPNIKGEKTSRAQILKAATDYIRFMRNRNNDYQKDIDLLKKQNTDIENQIRQLEKARAANQFARQSNEIMINTNVNSSDNNDMNENYFLKPKRFKNVSNQNNSSASFH